MNSLHIILVHGIWMKGFEMLLLRKILEQAGYKTTRFSYWSLHRTPEENVTRLFELLEKHREPCIIVAHSLGGIIVRTLFERHGDKLTQIQGVVSLGSPLNGSQVARFMADRWWLRWSLGKSKDTLCKGVSSWDKSVPWLSIAGTSPKGIGRYLGAIGTDGDGTVLIQETELNGVQALARYPASHTGMLFSRAIAQAILEFLEQLLRAKQTR